MHLLKAYSPIEVNVSGSVSIVMALQSLKALFPIVVKEAGRFISERLLHFAKA